MTHSIICFLEKVSGFASETFKLVKNFLDLFCKYWESPFRKICSARKFLAFFRGFGFAAAGRVQIRNSPGKRGYAAFGKRHFLPFFTRAARSKSDFGKQGGIWRPHRFFGNLRPRRRERIEDFLQIRRFRAMRVLPAEFCVLINFFKSWFVLSNITSF